jgi:hypothetical protein
MKGFISIMTLALAMAFTVPAFAGGGSTPQTQADCEKAGQKWDGAAKKCMEKQ